MSTIRYTAGGNYDPSNSGLAQDSLGTTDFSDPAIQWVYPETPGNGFFYTRTSQLVLILLDENRTTGLDHAGYGLSMDFSDRTVGISLTGGDLGDVLHSGSGNDTLNGGGGNDILQGGAGADTLSGGDGFDTASYQGSTSGVTVDLAAGVGSGGHAAGDTLTGISGVIGSAYADTIWGDSGNNVIEGGAGGDVMWGGGGMDTLSYASSSAGVTVNLWGGLASGGDATNDLFSGFANLRGSLHDDLLAGDNTGNVLDGMGSDGPLGDSLFGLGGNDRLIVRGDPAMVDGGDDLDTVVIAAGSTVTFAAGALVNVEAMSVLAGASVDLSALTSSPGRISASGDATIVATSDADRIIVSAGDHTITGGGGGDVTFAGAGADTFVFGEGWGRDTIYRIDTASDHLDLSALGLTLDDLTVRTASNGLDTLIYETGNTADWIVLKGVLLDKAAMPDGFLIL